MSEHGTDRPERVEGQREGFFEKVKEIFTGRDDRPEVGETGSEEPAAADEGAWDGSGEPPEVEIPESEAVQRHLESEDETDASEAATAEAPHEAPGGATRPDPDTIEDAVETEVERAGRGEDVHPIPEEDPEPLGHVDDDHSDNEDSDEKDSDAEESEEDRRRREEEFAREHDPADHDIDAGEEFRQRGDWTAEHGHLGEPQVDSGMPGGGSAVTNLRESTIEEVRDGGHGVGSAAPIKGGVMPFGHPIKAWHDSLTYVLPDEPGYDAEPHEWFIDAEAAERAGFRHAHGG